EPASFDIAGEGCVLKDIVDELLTWGVWITRSDRLRGQELVRVYSSNRLAVSAAVLRKECEHAAVVLKAAITEVLAKRK
ncbi:hypothetical protein V8E53_002984, partial [Lactarius tabidus]